MSGTATVKPTQGFAQRAIDLTFQLGSGNFTNTKANTLKVTGLRVQVSVTIPGTVPLQGGAQVAVYGLPLQVMNDLSSLGSMLYYSKHNSIVIEAGDVGGQMSAIFYGTIAQAYCDFDGGPQAAFVVVGIPGYNPKLAGAQPFSFQGSIDVKTILLQLCKKAGLTFQSNGVAVTLSNPYFPGTVIDQINSCCEAANLHACIQNNTLTVWNDAATTPSSGLVLSAKTGLVGYPTFLPYGISLTSLFNPALQNGQTFEVQSIIAPACGTWRSFNLTHDLETQTQGGPWFTTIQAIQPNALIPPGA